jgi:hypothetical protein
LYLGDNMANPNQPRRDYSKVVSDLRADRRDLEAYWGDVDEELVIRFLCGQATDEEIRWLRDHSEKLEGVRRLIEEATTPWPEADPPPTELSLATQELLWVSQLSLDDSDWRIAESSDQDPVPPAKQHSPHRSTSSLTPVDTAPSAAPVLLPTDNVPDPQAPHPKAARPVRPSTRGAFWLNIAMGGLFIALLVLGRRAYLQSAAIEQLTIELAKDRAELNTLRQRVEPLIAQSTAPDSPLRYTAGSPRGEAPELELFSMLKKALEQSPDKALVLAETLGNASVRGELDRLRREKPALDSQAIATRLLEWMASSKVRGEGRKQ